MNSENIYTHLMDKSKYKSAILVKRYVNFCISCHERNVNAEGYHEKHHVLPSSIFPKYKNLKLYSWNLSKLTARQHVIAHIMLSRLFPSQAKTVYRMLKYNNLTISTRMYEILRTRFSKEVSKRSSGTIWIRKFGKHKMVQEIELSSYLELGWELGRNNTYTKNKNWYYDPNSDNTGMFFEGKQPKGWEPGNRLLRNKVHAYNPNTKECSMFYVEEIPYGWLEGNINGKGVYYRNKKTDQVKLFKEGSFPNENIWEPTNYIKGKKYYHCPKTKENGLFIKGQQPKGWVIGNLSQMGISRTKGRKWYTNKERTENKMCIEGEQPEDWVRGRKAVI